MLERAIEVPVAQLDRIGLDHRRPIPAHVVSVIGGAAITAMIMLVDANVIVARHRGPIVLAMDVRVIPAAMAVIDRAHGASPT